MKNQKLSYVIGLCLLTAHLTRAAINWNFDSASGSVPYPVDTPVAPPILGSSQLSAVLPSGVAASITSGATAPGEGNFLLLSASSQAINSGTALVFTINSSGAVVINSLSYAAIVFALNQGPDQITWSYSVNYGGGNIGPNFVSRGRVQQQRRVAKLQSGFQHCNYGRGHHQDHWRDQRCRHSS